MILRTRLAAVLLAAVSAVCIRCASVAERPEIRDADIARVRGLFEARKFAELTALLEEYQASCDRDIRYEYAAQNGFLALDNLAPSHRALLDEWVRSVPGSWVPLTARAMYHKSSGWEARGTHWAHETSDEKFRKMTESFELALQDLEASLRLRPRQIYAYVILMEISQNFGDRERSALLVRKALELYPDSYILRRRHIFSLEPRWGGSYDAMDAFAREAAPHAARNPLIKSLPGFVFWDQADMVERDKDYRRAIALYERALSHGENWNFLYDLAKCYYRARNYGEARRTVDCAIALHPVWANAYGLRSMVSFAQTDMDAALKDLETMERAEYLVADDWPALRKWQSGRLASDGHALFRTDLPGAIAKYTLALRFDPKNADAYCWRGIAHDRTRKPEAALADLREAVALDPRMFSAYKGLEDALLKQGRFDEAVGSWTGLIRLEPGNDNAYLRRAGAYFRKGDAASAIADLNRACGMGNRQACDRLKAVAEGGNR